ncbi:MAG: GTP pyrophosphokinase [Candidatus Omnitrophica bacterium]|nr:GTP pyrophosphokinase [Candidatus Omnitrophota bacterium]MCB9722210.1 GTP pyrophosphokinase [Candidatus Omnitrophota bacterium]
MADLQRAIAIAVEAHRDQTRRNGSPYVLHPLRVMLSFEDETRRIIGVLHDVVEDSDWSLDDLREEGFAAEVVAAVDALTKREGEDYQEYLDRLETDALARSVKLADLRDNMNVIELPVVREQDTQRLNRYRQAYQLLSDRPA